MFTMLYDIIVAPIEMIVDWVFLFATNYMSIFGVMGAIVCVSVAINFLTLPIYNVADKIQNEEREAQKKLSSGIERIKAVFSGDERFMILQTFYRQNHYSPIYALRSSISVLIQIPFFMAAYHYLSNNELLKEGGFLVVKNLGEPDALFSVGGFAINVLPIFMTLINVVSGIVYTKGFPVREKVQVYGLAAVFLVLLYNSPSGLVLYWIMNNVFSLCKNFVKKTKNPAKVVAFGSCVLLLAVLAASFALNPTSFGWKKKFLLAFVVVLLVATLFVGKLITILRNKFAALQKSIFGYTPPPYIDSPAVSKQKDKTNFLLFISSAIGLALLAGFLLPSSVIATSPTEFSFLGQTESPLSYIYSSVCVFTGLFVLWPVVIYKMFSGKVRKAMPPLFFVLFACSLLNAYVFKHNYGLLKNTLVLGDSSILAETHLFLTVFPFVALIFVFAIYFICRKKSIIKFLPSLVFAVAISEFVFGMTKINFIRDEFAAYKPMYANKKQASESKANIDVEPIYNFSKTGKNVVVLFLDMTTGAYLPYIFEQLPYLKQQYSSFTFYPNTVSFGNHTVYSGPGLMGGYEYSNEAINERKDELIADKYRESARVMPYLFAEAGYDVMTNDMAFIGYTEGTRDENYDNIKYYEIFGKYKDKWMKENDIHPVENEEIFIRQNIKSFSLVQIVYPIFRNLMYKVAIKDEKDYFRYFADHFSCLFYMSDMTQFENRGNTFQYIYNGTPHHGTFLNSPDFTKPDKKLPNSCGAYNYTDDWNVSYYHAAAAAFKQIGIWLDFLKENDCYDNTRIIIVADHGGGSRFDEFKDFKNPWFAVANVLLLEKDFGATGEIKNDSTFMTNADTLFLAKDGLGLSEINPFTGQKLVQEKENGVNVLFQTLDAKELNQTVTFDPRTQIKIGKDYFHVRDNIFDESNWTPIEYKEKSVTAGGNK